MIPNLKIPEATEKGYTECPPGGCFDWDYRTSKNRRGRVQGNGQIVPTLQGGRTILVYEGLEDIRLEPKQRQERQDSET